MTPLRLVKGDPHEVTTAEEAWDVVEMWLPEGLDHARGILQRITWALENPGCWDTRVELRRRVMDGYVEHRGEMYRPENASLRRFHRDAREEALDLIVYSAMGQRHLARLRNDEAIRRQQNAQG